MSPLTHTFIWRDTWLRTATAYFNTDSFSSLLEVKTTLSVKKCYKICLKQRQISRRFKPNSHSSQIDDRSRERLPKCGEEAWEGLGRTFTGMKAYASMRKTENHWYQSTHFLCGTTCQHSARPPVFRVSESCLWSSGTMVWLLGVRPVLLRTIQPQRSTDIRYPNGIRTHNPFTPTAEDSESQSGHCDRLSQYVLLQLKLCNRTFSLRRYNNLLVPIRLYNRINYILNGGGFTHSSIGLKKTRRKSQTTPLP